MRRVATGFCLCALLIASQGDRDYAQEAPQPPATASRGAPAAPDERDNESLTTPLSAPTSRREFSSLIIAGMPKILSPRLDEVATRLSIAAGVTLMADWWQLDMAAFSTTKPFNGQAVADALGLAVVSDVTQDLILAPEVTPETIAAEARIFLLRLSEDIAGNGVWNGVKEGAYAMTPQAVRRESGEQPIPPPGKKPETGDARFFVLSGALGDEKVCNALGISPSRVKRPLLHYELSDFTVQHAKQQTQSYHYRGDMRAGFVGDGIQFNARQAKPAALTPTGPLLSLGTGVPTRGSPLAYFFNVARGGFWGWVPLRIQGLPSPMVVPCQGGEDDLSRVILRLDDFHPARVPDQPALDKLAAQLDAAKLDTSMKDADRLARCNELERAIAMERCCVMRSDRSLWADDTGSRYRADPLDFASPVRDAKRKSVEQAAAMLRAYAATCGPDGKWPEGSLNNWELRREYEPRTRRTLAFPPYTDNHLQLQQDKQAEFKGAMLFGTAEKASVPAFQVRIEPAIGTVTWIHGEPESDALAKGRSEELVRGVDVIAKAIADTSRSARTFDAAASDMVWVGRTFEGAKLELRYTATADYTVMQLLPGIVRVCGESLSGEDRQSVLVDLDTGAILRETPVAVTAANLSQMRSRWP